MTDVNHVPESASARSARAGVIACALISGGMSDLLSWQAAGLLLGAPEAERIEVCRALLGPPRAGPTGDVEATMKAWVARQAAWAAARGPVGSAWPAEERDRSNSSYGTAMDRLLPGEDGITFAPVAAVPEVDASVARIMERWRERTSGRSTGYNGPIWPSGCYHPVSCMHRGGCGALVCVHAGRNPDDVAVEIDCVVAVVVPHRTVAEEKALEVLKGHRLLAGRSVADVVRDPFGDGN